MTARESVLENHAAASEALRMLEAPELSTEEIMKAGRMLSLAGAQLMNAAKSGAVADMQATTVRRFDPRMAAANDFEQ